MSTNDDIIYVLFDSTSGSPPPTSIRVRMRFPLQKLLDALFGAPITPMDRIQIRRSWGEIVPGDHWSKSLAELNVRDGETLTVVDGRVQEKQVVVAPAPGTPQVAKKKKLELGVNKRPTVRRKPRNKGW